MVVGWTGAARVMDTRWLWDTGASRVVETRRTWFPPWWWSEGKGTRVTDFLTPNNFLFGKKIVRKLKFAEKIPVKTV